MAVTAEQIMQLRERTGISVMECKKALTEADGDMEKAVEILRGKSAASAAKKQDRELRAGIVQAYVHSNAQVGALVLLSCETDFVSKNEGFIALARDIAMHASAMRPESVEAALLQEFIKDPAKTIQVLLSEATQKFGERVALSKLDIFSV
jgi:elongation factor Ts